MNGRHVGVRPRHTEPGLQTDWHTSLTDDTPSCRGWPRRARRPVVPARRPASGTAWASAMGSCGHRAWDRMGRSHAAAWGRGGGGRGGWEALTACAAPRPVRPPLSGPAAYGPAYSWPARAGADGRVRSLGAEHLVNYPRERAGAAADCGALRRIGHMWRERVLGGVNRNFPVFRALFDRAQVDSSPRRAPDRHDAEGLLPSRHTPFGSVKCNRFGKSVR